jgi:hypothetical protein
MRARANERRTEHLLLCVCGAGLDIAGKQDIAAASGAATASTARVRLTPGHAVHVRYCCTCSAMHGSTGTTGPRTNSSLHARTRPAPSSLGRLPPAGLTCISACLQPAAVPLVLQVQWSSLALGQSRGTPVHLTARSGMFMQPPHRRQFSSSA